jgi:N-acetylglucosamine-6-phosphate deacetylase
VLTPSGIRDDAVVVVRNGVIAEVKDRRAHAGAIDFDAGDRLIAPGFVDLHAHGAGGRDFMSGSVADVGEALRIHARHGTTSMLPTTVTASRERTSAALRAIAEAMRLQSDDADGGGKFPRGADILGVHLEGPYINPKRAGGQDPEWIRPFDPAEYEEWASLAPIRMITLAPELPGAEAFIRHVAGSSVRVSAGHTDATLDEMERAMRWGVSHLAHFGNAMRGLHHREPGTVGAGLLYPALTVELIADGIHVHPDMLRLTYRVKGSDRIALVTDASVLCGSPDGTYRLGGREVVVKEGAIRLGDGTLKGSNLTMDRAVRNMLALGVPVEDVWRMAAENPARWIGFGHRKGRIEPGMDADLVVLDRDFNVCRTFVRGEAIDP